MGVIKKKSVQAWFFEVGAIPDVSIDEIGQHRPLLAPGRHWEPRADIVEEDRRIVITLDLAGIDPEEIQVSYAKDDNLLVIKGRRNDHHDPQVRRSPLQLEILFGPFAKAIQLPHLGLLIQKISLHYKNGMLCIIIPKTEGSQFSSHSELSENT